MSKHIRDSVKIQQDDTREEQCEEHDACYITTLPFYQVI